jgi:hypothetical protein
MFWKQIIQIRHETRLCWKHRWGHMMSSAGNFTDEVLCAQNLHYINSECHILKTDFSKSMISGFMVTIQKEAFSSNKLHQYQLVSDIPDTETVSKMLDTNCTWQPVTQKAFIRIWHSHYEATIYVIWWWWWWWWCKLKCILDTTWWHKYKTNTVALSPQANYTDWGTATCWRNLVPTFVDTGASRVQHDRPPEVVNLNFLDRSHYFSFK